MSELAEEIEVHDNQGLEGHLFSDDDRHGIITWSTVYPSAGCWALYCIAHILLSSIDLHRFRTPILIILIM
jgi:hypothetical protein